MLPHAGVGGWTPKPRKLIAASATMKDENWRLATTMMEGATFGSTCRRRRRIRLIPSAAAACTKSRCLTDSTSPRTTRAYTTHPAAERLRMMFRSPSPTIALIVMASRMNGNESWTSAMRMSAVEDARQEVPAELIGAERVAGRARRPEARGEVGRERVARREPRRRDRRHDDRDGEANAEPRLEMVHGRGGSSKPATVDGLRGALTGAVPADRASRRAGRPRG